MIIIIIVIFLFVIFVTIMSLLVGASLTAGGLLVMQVAVVPLVFKYSKTFRRGLVFANYIQWPLYANFEVPVAYGIDGTRNLSIEFYSKIDKCRIRLGVWHVVPQDVYEKFKVYFHPDADKDELNKLLDEELSNTRDPIIIYCHGNSTNRAADHRVKLYQFFQKMGFHTIAFDYRGFGDTTHIRPSERGVVEDSLMIYEWIYTKMNPEAEKPPIFVWGHSLGTGISAHLVGNLKDLSIDLLDRDLPLPYPNGLILECPFNNFADEVAKHPLSKLVTWLPYYENAFVKPFRECEEYTFKSDKYLSGAGVRSVPILILHSRDDVVVPFSVGEKLYKAIKESRREGDATIILHAFDKSEGLGHKYICNSEDLATIVGDFVEAHR